MFVIFVTIQTEATYENKSHIPLPDDFWFDNHFSENAYALDRWTVDTPEGQQSCLVENNALTECVPIVADRLIVDTPDGQLSCLWDVDQYVDCIPAEEALNAARLDFIFDEFTLGLEVDWIPWLDIDNHGKIVNNIIGLQLHLGGVKMF